MLQSTASASRARPTTTTTTSTTTGRRAALLGGLAAGALAALAAPGVRQARAAPGAVTPPEDVSSSELVQRLLAKTNAPGVRERRQRERLEAYNDKIYGEGYFEVEVGQGAAKARGISDDTASKIQNWQRKREERMKGGGGK
jgi:hypothetical protein